MGMDPATIGMTMQVAGFGMKAFGMMQQSSGANAAASAANQSAAFNSRIAGRNAKVAEVEERTIRHHGKLNLQRFFRDFESLQTRAGMAYASGGGGDGGVAMGTGTPLVVLRKNADEAAEEGQIREVGIATRAGQAREGGINERLKGDLALLHGGSRATAFRMQANQALTSGFAGLASSAGRLAMII